MWCAESLARVNITLMGQISRGEIFAWDLISRIFLEKFYFARINFREFGNQKSFARINFREFASAKNFARIKFREFSKNSRNSRKFLPAKICPIKVFLAATAAL